MDISPGKTIEFKSLVRLLGNVNRDNKYGVYFTKKPVFLYLEPQMPFSLTRNDDGSVAIQNVKDATNQIARLEGQVINYVESKLKSRYPIRHSVVRVLNGGNHETIFEDPIAKVLAIYDINTQTINHQATLAFHKPQSSSYCNVKGFSFYIAKINISDYNDSIGITLRIKDLFIWLWLFIAYTNNHNLVPII